MWRKQTDSRFSSPTENMPPTAPPVFDPAPAARHVTRQETAPSGSRILPGLRVRGEISGDSALFFEGSLDGPIHLRNADLTVGPGAVIRGDVEAREVAVQGTVEGEVRATVRIHLHSSSEVSGQLIGPRIAIDEGARFSGRVEMTRGNGAVEKAVAAPASSRTPAGPPALGAPPLAKLAGEGI